MDEITPTKDPELQPIEPLKAYLRGIEGEDAKKAFALRCEVSLAHLRMVAYGAKKGSESLAINLERETAGKVVAEDVRPDVDWAVIRNSRDGDSRASA